jgi:hypothetical protein
MYIFCMKIKKSGHQVRQFGKPHHEWHNLEAQERSQTSKGPITNL